MSGVKTLFNCYYDGKFATSECNITTYIGGQVKAFECIPQDFYQKLEEVLGISLADHRVWYKLPFENLGELKILCYSDGNFQRMCDAAIWTKVVDIFLEKDEDYGGLEINVEELIDEERRVEDNVADFVDEEESDNDEATPQNSDGEDETEGHYDVYKKGSGELKLEQVFSTIGAFKEAVVEYALKEGWNIKFTRWGSQQSEVRCTLGSGCPFKIYCSFEERIGMFLVKTLEDTHSCNKDGYSKVIKDSVIARLFLNDIRKDLAFKPKAMQESIEERYNIVVSNDQCRKAKAKALKTIQEEHNEQYARMRDYQLEILDSNPESTVELKTVSSEGGLEIFDKIYICYAGLKKAWLDTCRPIIGIDGCFLKNNSKGQLLAAVGRDGNNQFYPVAWAIVQVENEISWTWFIQKLKTDLNLGDGGGFTLISDRQKGLINAVDKELPNVEHRMCARHIYGNIKRVFLGKSSIKEFFWAVAKSFNVAEYEDAIAALKDYDVRVYDALMMRNPRNCSRAFFGFSSACEDVSNNFSESYNNTINKAREMPLVEMLETIKRQAMMRIAIRKKKAMDHTGKYTKKVAKVIVEEERHRKFCKAIPGPNGTYEVTEKNHCFRLNIGTRTCTCRRWSMTGIPCRHALKVINVLKYDIENYISDWYLTSSLLKTYSKSISPHNGINLWRRSGEAMLQPPHRDIPQGRKKTEKRKKSKHESPKKKGKGKKVNVSPKKKVKLTRAGLIVRCGRCGATGHNQSKCSNIGVEKPVKKKAQLPEEGCNQQCSQSQVLD